MRGPAETSLSVREGFVTEGEFFAAHQTYGRANSPYTDRLGVPNLTNFLSRVLLQHMRQHMPSILHEARSATSHLATATRPTAPSRFPPHRLHSLLAPLSTTPHLSTPLRTSPHLSAPPNLCAPGISLAAGDGASRGD